MLISQQSEGRLANYYKSLLFAMFCARIRFEKNKKKIRKEEEHFAGEPYD